MKDTKQLLHKYQKHIVWSLFGIIIVAAIFLRLHRFAEFSTFLGDQGRDAVIMYDLITFRELPQQGPHSSLGLAKLGPLYYYVMAPFLAIFNFNPLGIAYGIFFFSVIGLIAGFFVIKKQVNLLSAFVFIFLVGFNFHLVEIARFGWNPNLLPLVAFFTLYFAYRVTQTKKIVDAIILGGLFSLATQLHFLAFLLGIPMLLVFVYHLIRGKQKGKFLLNILLAIVSFFVFYAPYISYELQNEFDNMNKIKELFNTGGILTDTRPYTVRLMETVQAFVKHITQKEMTPGMSLASLAILFGLVGIAIKKYKPNSFVVLNILNVLIYLVIFSLLKSDRHPHYFASIYLSFFLMIGFLLSLIRFRIAQYALIAILVVAFLKVNIPKYYFLYDKPSNQVGFAKMVAESFKGRTFDEPIRMAALPATETHDQYRYFVRLQGVNVLPYSSKMMPKELYVICLDPNCAPVDDPIWPIASFNDRKQVDKWEVDKVTVFKIVHEKKK